MPQCWKSHVAAQLFFFSLQVSIDPVYIKHCNCRDQKDNINEVIAVAVDSEGASTECKFEVKVKGNIYMIKAYSNTPRLYSQWLNSVIYWLINHCTDWARTNVTSFSRQFDFHDVIYHNRRRNVVFTTT